MHIQTKAIPGYILLLLFIAGCGQKGPLYLPGDPSEIRTSVPTQQPGVVPVGEVEEEEEEEDDPR